MARFGEYCRYDEKLSFFGRLSYFIHGTPHIAKFLQSNYFTHQTHKIMSEKIKNILDMACGNGDYAFYLAEKYPWIEIDAVDINNENINYAKRTQSILKNKNIHFIQADLNDFRPDKKYDFVYFVDSLHAINNKKESLMKISSLLNVDATFYFQDCLDDGYSKTIINKFTTPFTEYKKKLFKGLPLSEKEAAQIFDQMKLIIINENKIIGFLGQLAWEIDQYLQTTKLKYAKTLMIPILKTICILEFMLPLGKKNEIFILGKKTK